MGLRVNKGFTLLELLVTIAIAGIFVSVAIPAMFDFIKSHKMASYSNAMHRSISIARSEAIKRGVNVSVCSINAGGTDCANASGWDNGWIVREQTTVSGADPIISIHEALTSGYTIHGSSDAVKSNITFTPSGSTITGAGSLIACYKGAVDAHTRTIQVTRFGKVSVKGANRTAADSCY